MTNSETEKLLASAARSLERGALSNAESTLADLGCIDPKINGAGTVTAAGAIYIASRFAARPTNGLLAGAVLRKGDTDTLASMAAALLGAIHDTEWLGPLAKQVQDAPYLHQLAEQLADAQAQPIPPPSRSPANLRKALGEHLAAGAHSEEQLEFPDGRRYRVVSVTPLARGRALRAHLSLDDGQTAFVDRPASPGPSDESSPAPTLLDRQSSLPAHLAPGKAVRITLPTKQVQECAAFYARLLGSEVPVKDGCASIADWLVIRQWDGAAPHDGQLTITLVVADLRAAREVLGDQAEQHADELRVRDPDGRRLLLRQDR